MLLNIFHRTGQLPMTRIIQLKMSVVLRSVDLGINCVTFMLVGSSIIQKQLFSFPDVINVNKWTLSFQSTYMVGNTSLCASRKREI